MSARQRADRYLAVLETGTSKGAAANLAGVRLDHLPYWRRRLPGFARSEALIVEGQRVLKDVARVFECLCGKTLVGRPGQEFCSRSCAQKEVKSAYWGPADTRVLEALATPLARRDLATAVGIPVAGLRSILNRLNRRGLVVREGAPRGLYCKWRAA